MKNFECIETLQEHLIHVLCIYKNYLISGNWNNTIKIWDLDNFQETPQCIKILREHNGFISSLCIYQDYLVSESNDGTIKIWDLSNARETVKYLGNLTECNGIIYSLCVYQDYLISGSKLGNWIDLEKHFDLLKY